MKSVASKSSSTYSRSADNAACLCLEDAEVPGIRVSKDENPYSWTVCGVPNTRAGIIRRLQDDMSHGTIAFADGDQTTAKIMNIPQIEVLDSA